ncbi:MAG: hypothetical protein K2X41_06095 [Hyphomicrobium sp.]|nr:hypothetical protein [Hyphomicrobium sp.]
MRTILALAVGSLIFGSAALAADAKIEAAVKTFDEVAANPDKRAAYCAMIKKMEEVGEDEKKAEAANAEMEGYFKTLGTEFEDAWSAGEGLKDGSPDLEVLDAAMTKLDESCKS